MTRKKTRFDEFPLFFVCNEEHIRISSYAFVLTAQNDKYHIPIEIKQNKKTKCIRVKE